MQGFKFFNNTLEVKKSLRQINVFLFHAQKMAERFSRLSKTM